MNDERHPDEDVQSGGPEEPEEEWPKGVEGTRGEKDSARRARQWYMEPRGLDDTYPDDSQPESEAGAGEADEEERTDQMENEEITQQEEGSTDEETEFEVRGGSLGETFDDVELGVALETPVALDVEEEPEAAIDVALGVSGGMSIDISNARTYSQAGAQTVFLRNTDALTFVMNIVASQQLVNSGRKFDANYQIIDFSTNTVKRNVWTRNVAFSWGTHFWISQGNNWGPKPSDYTTPAKWGLNTGLYIYRATVEVKGIGAFSYSRDYPFRVR